MQLHEFEWDEEWLETQARLMDSNPEWNAFVGAITIDSTIDPSLIDCQVEDNHLIPDIDLKEPQSSYSPTSSGYHTLPAFDSASSSPIDAFTPSTSDSSSATSSPQS
ncbi:hypothetical protein QQZ08_001497 [Neonectria magnoliae]|uniref:Uncharacterized protein n=1 Tax=Neonectria magnoliae TaxID=2732573 RepID=A0ABR1IE23_9HYPO